MTGDKGMGVLRRFRLRWILGSAVVLVAVPFVMLFGLYLGGGYVKTAGTWWYPFPTSFLSDYYVTGPFGMTSNTREDNPVWSQLPAFNIYQARITYAMSRGRPGVEVAWLLGEAEWPDRPAVGEGTTLNAGESAMSRALLDEGIDYHRVSRLDLTRATVKDGRLLVGEAEFGALLVADLHVAEPELLQNMLRISQAGVPVVWQGGLPARAPGWRDHAQRDSAVATHMAQLLNEVSRVGSSPDAAAALASTGVTTGLRRLPGTETFKLRVSRRVMDRAEVVLLFNGTAEAIARTFRLAGRWGEVRLLDPATGDDTLLAAAGNEVAIEVPPGRIRLLLLQRSASDVISPADAIADSSSRWDWAQWRNPPRQLHPMIRWWWPGNAVESDELRRELLSLYEAGFGGVEIQTLTIGMSQTHLEENEQSIYTVGTGAFFNRLKTVFALAGDLGMTVDLTLGSGWSSGGPFMDEHPEQQLLRAEFDVDGPLRLSTALPLAEQPWYVLPSNWIIRDTIGDFDANMRLRAVVAARLEEAGGAPVLTELRDISHAVSKNYLEWSVPEGRHRIFAMYQNASAHNVVASAYPGALNASPVLDHLNPGGIEEYLHDLGNPWLDALAPYSPRAVFVDSFELIGELPWTSGFAQRFSALMGYDVTPYLPLLFMSRGESKYVNVVVPPEPAYQTTGEMGRRMREDYDAVRQQMFLENFLQPLAQWTRARGVQLRLQAHGGYGDYLDAYKMADVPESEGLFAGGSYDFLKLAASAGHIAGRRLVSSESFITMTNDPNALTIEDYYRLAGNAFAAGINITVCHGYAYHYSP